MINFDINAINTPYFIVDENLIIKNLEILARVKREAGCKILLAQKAFSMYALYPLIGRYLDGTCASGLHEALLAHKYFRGENHVYSPAYDMRDFARILDICDHIIFNSFGQWQRFGHLCNDDTKSFGIRINPVTQLPEFHTGLDIAVDIGTPVLAVRCAAVHHVGYTHLNGRYMILRCNDGYYIVYAHLDRVLVGVDDQVTQGQRVAYSGNTGQSTGPHLHYGLSRNGQRLDPLSRVDLQLSNAAALEYARR